MLPIWLAAGLLDAAPVEGDTSLVPLALVKKHLRIEANEIDEDDLIAVYLEAAIASLDGPEGWLGRAIVEREYVRTVDCFSALHRLPYPPLVAVTKLERRDGDTWVALGQDEWKVVDGSLSPSFGSSWPYGAARVTYRAGYDPAAGRPLPKPILAAILLMTEDLFRNRGEVVIGAPAAAVPMAATVKALLTPYKIWRV